MSLSLCLHLKCMFKKIFFVALLSIVNVCNAQYIDVDAFSYSPQELIEDILIDSNCISNIQVTQVVGGNFNGSDASYGYFNAQGTSFPFQEGIVLSTGKLTNVKGPNATLSDDDAPNWGGDLDLEAVLNETNTLNATIIEFDFTAVASQISFRYIFASEEYQEGNSSTCRYSDLFGFLIRPVGQQQYTNIAVVPNTQTPVKVTTVHPEIPGSCAAINEYYFDQFNGTNVPINFNGQTKVLTAKATVVPNQSYHIKMVIADEQNYRYDSAVFLEAGSFQQIIDIGIDRLIATQNALCATETLELDATSANAVSYQWFKDGVVLPGETNATYTVTTPGQYNVEVTLQNNCISEGSIVIEYGTTPIVSDTTLETCDFNADGLTQYNLYLAETDVTNGDTTLSISGFYNSFNDADLQQNAIINPEAYSNQVPNETVFARIISPSGCPSIATIILATTQRVVNVPDFEFCDSLDENDGYGVVSLSDITSTFIQDLPQNAQVKYYASIQDAQLDINNIIGSFTTQSQFEDVLYIRIVVDGKCYALTSVLIRVFMPPVMQPDETVYYCNTEDTSPITLSAGVMSGSIQDYQWLYNGEVLSQSQADIQVSEIGVYNVTAVDVNGCEASRTITVEQIELPVIENIIVNVNDNPNTVSIEVSSSGLFVYAIDNPNGPFQQDSIFYDVPPGIHTVYVKNQKGCAVMAKQFSVLGFPQYFTPNGDGYHDTWEVQGITNAFFANARIYIFDRFGKIIAERNVINLSWDGTYNGNKLPSSDYWYLVSLENGETFRGHFSLIR